MKNLIRTFVASWYLLGWMMHVYLAFTNPLIYANFGRTAIFAEFSELWNELVMPNIVIFALALAAFELVVGILLIGKGKRVQLALAASILFNLFLVQLGLSGQAEQWIEDFIVNRLPNLIFIALQIPLFLSTFEKSIPELIQQRPRRGRKQVDQHYGH